MHLTLLFLSLRRLPLQVFLGLSELTCRTQLRLDGKTKVKPKEAYPGSFRKTVFFIRILVEPTGFEPVTSSMPSSQVTMTACDTSGPK